ncbi:MAG: TIGR00730 family Rossman fold protein [Bacteroidales bacterium]|nr:TIGR00730 family Rossman fold protein [Bacteroidales bacterium]
MKHESLALYCGSSAGKNPAYAEEARKFGRLCAKRGITIYYGGGSIGLMGAAAEASLEEGGKVIGVAPRFFKEGAVLATNLTEMIIVDSMSERKQLLEEKADAFVVFPGGYGTMDELFEMITDAQLGLHSKPVAVYNYLGFYDHLLKQLDKFMEEGFLRPFHHSLLVTANDLDELFRKLENYENSNDRSWLDKIKHQTK